MMNNTKNSNYIKNRKDGRLIAFQAIFSYDFDKIPLNEILQFKWLEVEYLKDSIDYATFLIKGTLDNLELIDQKIKSRLRNWDFNRITAIDRAILRFSIFSMIFEKDLPEKVIINEAVEIAKEFGNEDSYKFINGILDAVKRSKESS